MDNNAPFNSNNKMLLVSLVIVCLSPFTAFSVKALSLPKITVFEHIIDEHANNRGKRLVLTCKATGDPKPLIIFQREGVTLRNLSRLERHSAEELFINNVTYQNDNGLYRCVAKNSQGEVFNDKKIYIPTLGEFKAGFRETDPPLIETVRIGDRKKIYCPQHTHAYPLQYLWATKYMGRPGLIRESRRVHMLSDGKALFFSMVTKDDIDSINAKGGVSCVMKIGTKLIYSQKIILKSDGRPTFQDIRPAIFEELEGNRYILEGESTVLKCAASGNPLPQVKWYRNGIAIQVNDSTKYGINSMLPEKLTLREVKADMEGEYKCEFKNRAGDASSTGRIFVATPPKIIHQLKKSITKNLKQELKLYCDASGTGPLNYTWFRNGSELTSYFSEDGSIKVEDSVLTLTNVSFNDQGTYQCFVSSKYGEDFSVTSVTVKQPASGIIGNQSLGADKNTSTPNDETTSGPLELKYIILISCGGAIVVVLTCGGLFMYCRTKKDHQQEQFIPIPKPGYNDYSNGKPAPIYAKPDFPPPPINFTDSSDDGMSTFGGAKMNDPEFIHLMHKLREANDSTPAENFYFDIPSDDGKHSITPSTEL